MINADQLSNESLSLESTFQQEDFLLSVCQVVFIYGRPSPYPSTANEKQLLP